MGIFGLTLSCANSLGRYGVRSNAVAPVAGTRMTIEQRPEVYEADIMSPENVAPPVVYLASTDSSWLNGRVIWAGGGRHRAGVEPRDRAGDRPRRRVDRSTRRSTSSSRPSDRRSSRRRRSGNDRHASGPRRLRVPSRQHHRAAPRRRGSHHRQRLALERRAVRRPRGAGLRRPTVDLRGAGPRRRAVRPRADRRRAPERATASACSWAAGQSSDRRVCRGNGRGGDRADQHVQPDEELDWILPTPTPRCS